MKSKHIADELFDKTTQEAALTINSLLSERGPIIAAVLDRLCDCYADIFKLQRKLASVPKETTKICSAITVELGKTYVCGGELVPVELGRTYEKKRDDAHTENSTQVSTDDPVDSTEDTSNSPSIDSTHEFNFPEILTICQGIDNNHTEEPVCPSIQGNMDKNKPSAPQAPPFTMPKMQCKASLSEFSEGQRVRLWSDTKHEWLQGIVRNVFTSSGSWDNFAVPTGVIQVESNVGTKFIRTEEMNCLQRSVTAELEEIWSI